MADPKFSDPLAWRIVKAPSLEEIEAFAEAAFRRLPDKFRALCEGLVIRVEDFPTDEVLDEMGAESEFDLLGLFQGVGLPFRSESASGEMPNMVWLYRDDGSENPDFVLNKPAYRKAKILVADDNFGCGSSREHAPWALMDFGIRCVISTSFGDIFYNNCFKNGVLPIKVKPQDLEKLFDDAERGANATLSIDLEKQEIRGPDGGMVKFEIDPHRKHCLLNGLDDIGLTMVKQDKIDRFEQKAKAARAWV